ncbi:GRAM domain-containing protein 2A isoform X4 [Monodelphis domestica]|uniref:GRAM domain-containing protein 2A isoform X4 n=1 Tax=Monodelphis domestica TaxID=13616 RepID=UPI0004436507|nr:GRAM domain-containing protein 2A isoform X4 [Monodelphis domestica]
MQIQRELQERASPASVKGTSHSFKQMHEKTVPLKIPVDQLEKLEEAPKERSPFLETLEESVHLPEGLKDEEIKKSNLEVTPNKYNHQYHKLFKDIPPEETVLKVCSCALQRDILIQGRLYISHNWLCFHASLFGKDIKYIFVSLISRDSVYDVLRRVCTHLQPSSKKSLSVREYPDEPDSESLVRSACGSKGVLTHSDYEGLIPEMKWRKMSPPPLSLSLSDDVFPCIHRGSMSSLATKESSFSSEKPLASDNAIHTEEELEGEPEGSPELRPWDYQLLKVFFVLICLLVVSSSYMAFRIFRLEQQLCSLNWDSVSYRHR